MPIISIREALRQAMDEEMERDPNVLLMGEEVAEYNGAYKVSRGLWDKYGDRRVKDTPITEEGFAGIGIGAALAGLRPIVEFMTFNFAIQALDQIYNNAAKMMYMSGGQFKVPIVFRGPNGPAEYLGSQHSQAMASVFAHCPGLKVIAPATAYDTKGLMKSAIRDNNPVIMLEGELMYSWEDDVPDREYTIPIGEADIKKAGDHVTLIVFGKPLRVTLEAAKKLEAQGISAEVLDLRSVRPLDEAAIVQSVEKTGRCVVIDESWPTCSVGSHVAWVVSNKCFDLLDAPVELVSSIDVPMPYNHSLELAIQPSVDKIAKAAKSVLYE